MDRELKLGKLPAEIDAKQRTIQLSSILIPALLPALPESYNIDAQLGGIDDNREFGNRDYGNCVIAARAHQTLRFEKFEQERQIEITDQEVVNQYFIESGGGDWGLVLLRSLKSWRKNGWPVGGKIYRIHAFAAVDWKDHDQVKHCIHLLRGINFGMKVYQKDIEQFKAGEPWHLTGDDGKFEGGHGVYAFCWFDVAGYDENGIICNTWGVEQHLDWDFWDVRIDEAYGIVDDRNKWMDENSPLNVEEMDRQLKKITGEPKTPGATCCICKAIHSLLKRWKKRRKAKRGLI